MRGLRTWAAISVNWLLIFVLLIAGNFGVVVILIGIVILLASFAVISSDLKWWQEDVLNLDLAATKASVSAKQIAEYRKLVDEEGKDIRFS